MMPSIAYNLIIPTLAAFTGMGAFSVAFNVVSHWQEKVKVVTRQPVVTPQETSVGEVVTDSQAASPSFASEVPSLPVEQPPVTVMQRVRVGNPWVAGIVAMLLAVVLGNLGTPRVFLEEGILKAGGYGQPSVIQQQL